MQFLNRLQQKAFYFYQLRQRVVKLPVEGTSIFSCAECREAVGEGSDTVITGTE